MSTVDVVLWDPAGGDVAARTVGEGRAADDVVVLHAGEPPTPDAVAALVAALDGVDAVATFSPLTDAVKGLDDAHRVVSAPDRTRLGRLGLPQALTVGALDVALATPGGSTADGPAHALLASGRRVRAVPAPA